MVLVESASSHATGGKPGKLQQVGRSAALQASTGSAAFGKAAQMKIQERRRTRKQGATLVQADSIETFSLDNPPPFDVRAAEKLHEVLGKLPDRLRCPVLAFDADATCKEACLLVTHTFWYTFVSLLMRELRKERDTLLQLMATQYARLTLALSCPHDAFFDHFPPLVAHVVLISLRRHGCLGSEAMRGDQGPTASAVFRHIVALLGGARMSDERVRQHMRFAERPWTDAEVAAAASPQGDGRTPWTFEGSKAPRLPPLAQSSIPALPSLERSKPREQVTPPTASEKSDAVPTRPLPGAKGRAAWKGMSVLVQASKRIDVAAKGTNDRAVTGSSGSLRSHAGRAYRPPKVTCDLLRQSPLVAIFKGAEPEHVLAETGGGLEGARGLRASASDGRLSYGGSGSGGPADGPSHRATVRQSAPGLGIKTRLGGVSSFRTMQPVSLVERARERLKAYEADRHQEVMTLTIFERAVQNRMDDIDRQRDSKLALPAPELADFSLDLAENLLHPTRHLY